MENAISFDYFVYSRPAGERRFTLTDLARGTVGLGTVFQVRRLDGKTVVYTTR